MPRLFVALELDPATRQRVIVACADLVAELRGVSLRWVRPEHLHLTLVFLGDVHEASAAAVVAEMRRDIPEPAFEIELGGFGVFPVRGVPRVLWLGVRKGADAVIALQRIVAARLEDLGFAPEPRPFSPHLTLARWPGRDPRVSRKPHHIALDGETLAALRVGAVTLFRSQLSPRGPFHTVLAESRLTGSSESVH